MKNLSETVNDSSMVVDIIKPIIDKIFDVEYDTIHHLIRKAAHLTEFAMLGVPLALFLLYIKKEYGITFYGFSCFYALCVAVIDEFIQSFTGRGSAVSDVIIDLTGFLIGFGITLLVSRIIKKYSKYIKKKGRFTALHS